MARELQFQALAVPGNRRKARLLADRCGPLVGLFESHSAARAALAGSKCIWVLAEANRFFFKVLPVDKFRSSPWLGATVTAASCQLGWQLGNATVGMVVVPSGGPGVS